MWPERPGHANESRETVSERDSSSGGGFLRDAADAPKTAFDVSLRPPVFGEFVGQAKVKAVLMMRARGGDAAQ